MEDPGRGAENMSHLKSMALMLALTVSPWVRAQTVEVADAWARATVAGQSASGAFMNIRASEPVRLVAVSTMAAGVSEVHEMKMEQNVMKMAAIPALELPAGKWVELKPGGYHVMLMDLKKPLTDASTVTLNLVFENAKGARSTQQVQVPVRAMGMNAPKAHEHTHKH
jgi:copper(I)-binding protein